MKHSQRLEGMMSKEDCHTCGEEFEDNCEFCSFAYPFCSLECYDKYDEGAAMDNKRISEIVDEEMIKQDANRYRDMRKILAIPKSIADEIEEKKLDGYGVFQTLAQKKHIISDPEPFCDLSDGFISWCENNEKWWAIMNAYLAGKALGVDLVKVVEGINDNY